MEAKLYSLRVSSPGHAARSMMELKGIEPKVVRLMLDGIRPAIDGRPAAAHARRLDPEPFATEPIPWMLPEWLAPLAG